MKIKIGYEKANRYDRMLGYCMWADECIHLFNHLSCPRAHMHGYEHIYPLIFHQLHILSHFQVHMHQYAQRCRLHLLLD